jgi:hypothetical protein
VDSAVRWIRQDEKTASQVIDGEAIIIHLTEGTYYSMPDVGAEIWERLAAAPTLGELVEHVVARYQVDRVRARRDVEALLTRLADEKLVTSSAAPGSGTPEVGVVTGRPYRTPELHCYRDMAELLALDPPTPGVLDTLLRERPPEPTA